jgi:site-specific DNA-methyltransferase (adenine-specific)
MTNLRLESVLISSLSLDPTNARRHDSKNLASIEGSLRLFGQRKPIVVSGANVVVAGNGTLEAAKSLGWSEIDVVRIPVDWSAEQVKAYALADNRTAELAEWDAKVLADQLIEIDAEGWNVSEFGFEPMNPTGDLDDDEPLSFDDVESKVKLGELWQLGEHRLLCGDSTDEKSISYIMNGELADLVFTDPPYRMNALDGSDQWVGRSAAKVGESIKDIIDFEPAPFLESLNKYFDKGMNAFIFCNKDLVPDYLNWALKEKYAFNILFWKKPNALPLGGQHRPDVEYILYFRKNAIWNNALSDVNYSKCLEFGRDDSTKHPTMKPLDLIINEIKIASNKESIVVDPFGGSGSTLIACEKLKRKCRMIELDPKYCDVIIDRWERLTGLTATRLEQ